MAVAWEYARFDTPTGPYWLPSAAPRCETANRMRAGEIYDKEIVDAIALFIRPRTAVLDIGCCYGQMSVLFAEMVGTNGLVIAMECSPFCAKLARMSFVERKLDNILLYENAAYDRSGIILPYPEHNIDRDGSFACAGVEPGTTGGYSVCSL